MHVARALGVRAAETPPRRDGPRTAVRGGRRVCGESRGTLDFTLTRPATR